MSAFVAHFGGLFSQNVGTCPTGRQCGARCRRSRIFVRGAMDKDGKFVQLLQVDHDLYFSLHCTPSNKLPFHCSFHGHPCRTQGTKTYASRASEYFDSLSRKVTNDLGGDDFVRVAWLSVTLFFVVGGYWLLRSLKDPIMAAIDGVEYIPQAKIASLFVVFALVIVCKSIIRSSFHCWRCSVRTCLSSRYRDTHHSFPHLPTRQQATRYVPQTSTILYDGWGIRGVVYSNGLRPHASYYRFGKH